MFGLTERSFTIPSSGILSAVTPDKLHARTSLGSTTLGQLGELHSDGDELGHSIAFPEIGCVLYF